MNNEIDQRKEAKINIYDEKIEEVANKITKNMGIDNKKANAILQFGVADAILLNRFRSIFKDEDLEE
jgi:hypothetical protein